MIIPQKSCHLFQYIPDETKMIFSNLVVFLLHLEFQIKDTGGKKMVSRFLALISDTDHPPAFLGGIS